VSRVSEKDLGFDLAVESGPDLPNNIATLAANDHETLRPVVRTPGGGPEPLTGAHVCLVP